ncbi:MAG: DUF4065 domain-containing protein [Rhodobacteraceae bacterium]|nr:DUF4065 domain-containing protein [Paracoccaceae bacterium]
METRHSPYDARQISNWFVKRAQDRGGIWLTTILKLAYIAHGWHLEIRKAPLFHNPIEAWQYGPVIPDLYEALVEQEKNLAAKAEPKRGNALRWWGYRRFAPRPQQEKKPPQPVTELLPGYSCDFSKRDNEFLEQVWQMYGGMTAAQLSALTHEKEGPWEIATQTNGYFAKIPNILIRKHYEMKRLQSDLRQLQGKGQEGRAVDENRDHSAY